jgi:hypothetical protein
MQIGFADDPAMLLLALVGGHALADFGLQTLYVAMGKDRYAVDDEGRQKNEHWLPVLFAHCAIHGLFVGLATGYAWLGWAEIAVHFATDDAKCAKRFGYETDQLLHYAAKLVWGAIAIVAYNWL